MSVKASAAIDTTNTDISGESTSASFKLPSVLDGYRNPARNQRSGSSSSSSGDDADTVPLKMAVPGKYLSMSSKKPVAKSTPKCKSGNIKPSVSLTPLCKLELVIDIKLVSFNNLTSLLANYCHIALRNEASPFKGKCFILSAGVSKCKANSYRESMKVYSY